MSTRVEGQGFAGKMDVANSTYLHHLAFMPYVQYWSSKCNAIYCHSSLNV